MINKFLQIVCCIIIPAILTAQDPCSGLNYHAFKAESLSGTYTDLEALGTPISVSGLDDGISGPQEIGFTFEYQCQSFTQFIFNTNGFIKLGVETTPKTNLFFSNAQSTSGGVFNDADSNNVNLIVAFNNDIESATGLPEFSVYTGGVAPYRICTIQWKNMREWSSDPATKQYVDMDFQIKLYETTNVIEFVYGDWMASENASNYKTAACGLKGKSNADDQLLVVVKSSSAFWHDVAFHNGNYLPNESFNFGNPPDRPKPDSGRTYRFTPTRSNDLTVQQLYTMGQSSSYYSAPITISANIRNSGFNTMTNIPVYLETTGANVFRDTQYIAELSFMEDTRIHFDGFEAVHEGASGITILVGDDDSDQDNQILQPLETTPLELNYALDQPATGAYGFLSGVQGIYYALYPVHGSASIQSINAFIADNNPSVGKTVFGIALDAAGNILARSDNYVIQESDLGQWHAFSFTSAPVVTDNVFYAGFGMTSSLTEFAPLGVQSESPVRPNTYYTSFVNGTGIKPMDTLTFANRFMIGATLNGTPPIAGVASADTSFCAYGRATLKLNAYTGFVSWQSSADGLNEWADVAQSNGALYETEPLTSSTYFRAKVFQPGFTSTYSNTVFVEVHPEQPVITASGDALQSNSVTGNQWYDENGPIDGATDPYFLATHPGTYYVIVTEGDCVSAPSNGIELLSVSVVESGSTDVFKLYPNPVQEMMWLHGMSDYFPIQYTLFNGQGVPLVQNAWSPDGRVSTTDLPSGFYMISIERPQGREVHPFFKL